MNSKSEYDSTRDWPGDLELRIDQICDEFEISYQQNRRPRIEDYLDETLGEVATTLLVELVMVEIAYRRKAGDTPTLDEYVSRFPSYSDVLRGLSDHFQASAPGGYKTPPKVPHLESFEFLGSGSFGAVWKAWDTTLRRFVAVKTPIRPVPTEQDRVLIQREAQVMARIKHPHIVPVHSCGEVDGRVYVIYEFVPGKTLKDRIDPLHPFEPREAVALCEKVARALHHVHQQGIVHRDLKPANILIDPQGEPHVMDFGLAKLLDSGSTIGGENHPLGTPAYMSPEQALGRSKETDARSDVYSLGVILYELLSGKPVFQGRPDELLKSIVSAAPPPLTARRPNLDLVLQKVCEKCLEKQRDFRYATAGQLATDLQKYLNHEKFDPPRVPQHVRAWRWLGENRRWAIAALAVLVPIVILALLMMPEETPSAATPPPTPQKVHVITEPTGVTVVVRQCDPKTGEPAPGSPVAGIMQSPGVVSLLPGRYQLHLTYNPGQGLVTHQVDRTVPGPGGLWPSMTCKWEQYKVVAADEVEWPPVIMPDRVPSFELVLMPGTDELEVTQDGVSKIVKVLPFYVAPREFTYGDFVTIRPGVRGGSLAPRAAEQPAMNTMPVSYTYAEQWAEESGCRLLTDLEFEYLARLAQQSQSKPGKAPHPGDNYDQAGGATFDEIPAEKPVRGILSGYAEWTSTWATSPIATVRLPGSWNESPEPEQHRIIRGGVIENSPSDYPRKAETAAASTIYKVHPRVGFRLARSAPPRPPQPKVK